MTAVVKIVEDGMYLLAAFGVGAASYGIYSIIVAFSQGKDQLLAERREEAEQRRLGRRTGA